jgi:hypothetical protein
MLQITRHRPRRGCPQSRFPRRSRTGPEESHRELLGQSLSRKHGERERRRKPCERCLRSLCHESLNPIDVGRCLTSSREVELQLGRASQSRERFEHALGARAASATHIPRSKRLVPIEPSSRTLSANAVPARKSHVARGFSRLRSLLGTACQRRPRACRTLGQSVTPRAPWPRCPRMAHRGARANISAMSRAGRDVPMRS